MTTPAQANGAGHDLSALDAITDAVESGAGLPAVIVPNGFGDRGLPTSLQLMGRAWEENTILAAASAYQSLTDWHHRHPPVS